MRTASSVLVLLHGRWYRSGSMHDLTDRLGLPGTECVAPAAAERTWYPGRFMEPRAANEPALSDAIARVHEVLDELEAEGVEPERIVLGGFSQGGCVACDALAQRPRPVAALVVLNGGLIGADEEELARPARRRARGPPGAAHRARSTTSGSRSPGCGAPPRCWKRRARRSTCESIRPESTRSARRRWTRSGSWWSASARARTGRRSPRSPGSGPARAGSCPPSRP